MSDKKKIPMDIPMVNATDMVHRNPSHMKLCNNDKLGVKGEFR